MARTRNRTIASAVVLTVCALQCFGADTRVRENAKALRDAKPLVRIAAVRELGQIRTAESTGVLVSHLGGELDNYVKKQVIEALALHGSTVALTAVLDALEDRNPSVRQKAMRALASFKTTEPMLNAVTKTLDRENAAAVKHEAVNVLRRHQNQRAVTALGAMIKQEKDPALRKAAVQALGTMKSRESDDELKRHENDPVLGKDVKRIRADRRTTEKKGKKQ